MLFKQSYNFVFRLDISLFTSKPIISLHIWKYQQWTAENCSILYWNGLAWMSAVWWKLLWYLIRKLKHDGEVVKFPRLLKLYAIYSEHWISGTVNFNFRNRPSLAYSNTCLLSRQQSSNIFGWPLTKMGGVNIECKHSYNFFFCIILPWSHSILTPQQRRISVTWAKDSESNYHLAMLL